MGAAEEGLRLGWFGWNGFVLVRLLGTVLWPYVAFLRCLCDRTRKFLSVTRVEFLSAAYFVSLIQCVRKPWITVRTKTKK